MSDIRITVCGDGQEEKEINAPVGAYFLQLLKMNGYPLICCNGKGTCGRCRIRFAGGMAPLPTAADRIAFDAGRLREGWRLACMHRVSRECRIEVGFVRPGEVSVVTASSGMKEAERGADSRYVTAIDLGTTTIAMSAVDLESLREWSLPDGEKRVGGPSDGTRGADETGGQSAHPTRSGEVKVYTSFHAQNPQRRWGSDVISRIRAAGEGEETRLTETVKETLREGMTQIEQKMGHPPEAVCLAGNTTMEHLLMGLDVSGLGKYPFLPVTLEEQRWQQTVLLPGISAFVGADILAGLLACGFGEMRKGCRLFIDLGTNGEMAIGDGERLICTATAAGPAFEGGASANLPGTDMVALLARLLEEGVIDSTGLLGDPWFEDGWQEGKLRITQQDVRALQMAKAAVRAGVELLMRRMGVTCDEVEQVYLAGGFGYYLDVEKAARIGLFPKELAGRVRAVGNTSLLGAALYGARKELREAAKRLCADALVMNLAEEPDFEALYLDSLNL